MNLVSCIERLIHRYRDVRPMARALKVDAAYLSRLRHGTKLHPSRRMLKKLGIRQASDYWIDGEPR